MRRLQIVGKSDDNRRLILASVETSDTETYEVPITDELEELLRRIHEDRRPGGRSRSRRGPQASGPEQDPLPLDIDIPLDPAPEAEDMAGDGPAAPGSLSLEPEPQPTEPPVDFQPRRTRVHIPDRSRLTPAEIQTLIRQGRGVRAVAQLAGTPVAWVRYLAVPIKEERMGVVAQLLAARQARPRLGESAQPVGAALTENLRRRGIRAPEDALRSGFSAYRLENGEWRVRLTFRHRGERHTALWGFDPHTRRVDALNRMANLLGWIRPAGGAVPARRTARKPVPPSRSGTRARPADRRVTVRRVRSAGPAGAGSTSARSAKRTAAARKRTARRAGAGGGRSGRARRRS